MIISHRYKAQDTPARRTFEQALTGAFMSAVIKDLRPSALPFVASLIRHYTMVAVAQQCGKAHQTSAPLFFSSLLFGIANPCCLGQTPDIAFRFVMCTYSTRMGKWVQTFD